ncbi:zinc-binding dehydrogenase [Streptomyces canus]|uniref:zinc-binding dehydrogenase n=1 Tax=Streptomyces canus TaxID=58343 RepID=UPI00386F57AB|nr:zinc-binding dehydrogenase [Streptomyces canus]
MVLDPISLDTAARARSLAVLRPGGTLVSILPVPIDPDELADIAERGIRYEALLVEADGAGMQAIADLVETGALRAHIEATFPGPWRHSSIIRAPRSPRFIGGGAPRGCAAS